MKEEYKGVLSEEDCNKSIDMLTKAESLFHELPEEKQNEILVDTANSAYVASHLPLAQYGKAMLMLGYQYGRKEK